MMGADSIYISSNETCVTCGATIPEGRQICVNCEVKQNDDIGQKDCTTPNADGVKPNGISRKKRLD